MVTPVELSNGASAARKSCCSVLVHSAHRVVDPPICELAGEAEPLPPDPPQAPTASTTAAPAATRATLCACFIETSSLPKADPLTVSNACGLSIRPPGGPGSIFRQRRSL